MLRLTLNIIDLVQREQPRIRVELGWGQEHSKTSNIPDTVQDRTKVTITDYTRFRLEPKSLTLDDLERPKRHSCRNEKIYGAHQKNLKEDIHIFSGKM